MTMISELLGPAVEWLGAPGPPNWMFLVALLTQAAYWSQRIRERVVPLLDSYLPGGGE